MFRNIEKKVNSSHIVWFGQSNSWIQFEEPAWFVKKLHQRGIDSNEISRKCARKYKLSPNECRDFVYEICTGIEELSKPVSVSPANLNSSFFSPDYIFIPYSIRHYLIGNKRFTLIFETRLAEYFIHPSLAHLEMSHSDKADVQFEIFNHDNISGLREKNHPETTASFKDFNHGKFNLP
jgi:hypothetical protein